MGTVAVRDPAILTVNHFELSSVGIRVSGEPTFEEWRDAVELTRRSETGVMWWIGDLLNYGEGKWGEMYTQAIQDTGLAYDTLASAKYVASNVDFCLRNQNLGFHHHKVVAKLPPKEQKIWLDKAEEDGLSVAELRREVRSESARVKEIASSKGDGGKFTVAECQDVIQCDSLISDPPYGILDQPWEPVELEAFTREWAIRWNQCGADTIALFWSQDHLWLGRQVFDECLKNYKFQQMLVWVYRNNKSCQSKKGFKQTWEPIFFYRRIGSGRTIEVGGSEWGDDLHDLDTHIAAVPQSNFNDDNLKVHPAQKPTSVMRWLVNALTNKGELVCDPFCGSGTTGIAALQLGRSFYGIEQDADYREAAERRIAAYGKPK